MTVNHGVIGSSPIGGAIFIGGNMSRKDKEKKDKKINNSIEEETSVENKNQLDKLDKRIYSIVSILGVIAILVIIIITIFTNSDSNKIRKEFNLSDKHHVFETISMSQFKSFVENNQTFQVFIGNGDLEDAEFFAYSVNEIAKEHNINKIYYLSSKRLTNEDVLYIREKTISTLSFSIPTMIYFENVDGVSKSKQISSTENVNDYGNYHILLEDYFNKCYSE